MNTITLEINNPEKRDLLLSLLAELSFVRVLSEPDMQEENFGSKAGSIFDAAGRWAERDINASLLRKAAWKR